MLNHLFNCHGEWGLIAAAVSSLPILSLWVKSKLGVTNAKKEKEND